MFMVVARFVMAIGDLRRSISKVTGGAQVDITVCCTSVKVLFVSLGLRLMQG